MASARKLLEERSGDQCPSCLHFDGQVSGKSFRCTFWARTLYKFRQECDVYQQVRERCPRLTWA